MAMSEAALSTKPTSRRIAGQGALLFSGFAAAQALSFVRNVLLGHALSRGDFGIAATIALILQLIETLSDLGSDRLFPCASRWCAHCRSSGYAQRTLMGRPVLPRVFVT